MSARAHRRLAQLRRRVHAHAHVLIVLQRDDHIEAGAVLVASAREGEHRALHRRVAQRIQRIVDETRGAVTEEKK